ncbi:MAG: hypothetical protein ABIR33_13835 [Pyrinomonadaceae bacterium]
MLKDKTYFLAAAILILTALGCRSCETIDSSKLDPSEIYQEYSITASTNTTVKAELRVSGATGTTVALVVPAKIEHNGKPMDENLRTVLSGTFYSDETVGFAGSHTFVFTDSSGKQFTNSVTFDPIKIEAENIEINKNIRTLVVPLSRGLASGESVSIQFASEVDPPKTPATNSNSNAAAGPDYLADISGSVDNDAKTLTIDTESLKNFAIGKAAMRITVKATRQPLELGIRGGAISYQIQSPPVASRVN